MTIKPNLPSVTEELLKKITDHRERVLVQLSSAPPVVLEALQNAGVSVPRHELSAKQQWQEKLGVLASRSKILGAVYGATPWGEAKRQLEEENIKIERDKADLQEKHEARLREVIVGSVDDASFLESTDFDLLDALHGDGYFQVPIGLVAKIGRQEAVSYVSPRRTHQVSIGSDRQGNLGFHGDRLPEKKEDQMPWLSAFQAGAVPSGLSDHKSAIYERWLVLLHEASHCQFSEKLAPFSPTPGKLSAEAINSMNQWMFGPLLSELAPAKLLSESLADTYSAMLLLESTAHDPDAVRTVKEAFERRKAHRVRTDHASYAAQGMGGFSVYGGTEWALAKVLSTADQWRGKPANELLQLASTIASDSVLEYASPDRKEGHIAAGPLVANQLIPGMFNRQVIRTVLQWAQHRNASSQWTKEVLSNHPAGPLFQRIMTSEEGSRDSSSWNKNIGEWVNELNHLLYKDRPVFGQAFAAFPTRETWRRNPDAAPPSEPLQVPLLKR